MRTEKSGSAWFLPVAFLLLFIVSFLSGAEANIADLRAKGYNVPHLWQRLEPYRNPCEKGDSKR